MKNLENYTPLIKYGIIACCCAGIDFSIFTLLTQIIKIPYLYTNVFSVHIAIFLGIFLKIHFMFQEKNKIIIRIVLLYLVGLIGLLIGSGLLVLFIEKISIDLLISKVLATVVVAFVQLTMNQFIAFKQEF
jgi:putative flippase GtrA